MKSYKDQMMLLNEKYNIWLSKKIEPMVEFDTPWMETNNYILNNHGLRCDNFFNLDKKDHILFSGCEYSLPMGKEMQESWAYKVYTYILGTTGTYRNISYPGADAEKIVSNIIKYVDTYGPPLKLFVLMPEIIRSYGYWPEGNVYKPKMYRQLSDGQEHNAMALPNDIPFNLLLLKYIRQCRVLESYCKSNGIELLWTTWDKQTSEIIFDIEFDSFFSSDVNVEDQNDIYNHFIKAIKEKRK